ncbi:MAG TPA: hypothetical protein VJW94_00220 [Candidatus Acidoferrum sp.]|nr:hypothetical protein [Candidatus Acidoferrum sp.]
MKTTVGMTEKYNTAGFKATGRISAARFILRVSLGGLALLLWQAPSAKAQECCPDQNTEAELARFESSAKKPMKIEAVKVQQGNPSTGVKTGSDVAAGNKKSNVHATRPAVRETLQKVEPNIPATGKPLQRVEAVGDGNVQKKPDGQGSKDTGGAAAR